jgi:hypothetical protein
MSNNFDLRKFLTENKLTSVAKTVNETTINEYEHHYRKVGGECRKYNDEGDYTVVSMHYCQYNEGEAAKPEVNEMHGGYLEVMGDEFHIAAKEIAKAWVEWRNGPATEPEDIEPAREDVLEFLKSMIR